MINKLIEKIRRKIAIKYLEKRVKTFSLTRIIPGFELMELSPNESEKYQKHIVIDMVRELSEKLVEKNVIEVETEDGKITSETEMRIKMVILPKK